MEGGGRGLHILRGRIFSHCEGFQFHLKDLAVWPFTFPKGLNLSYAGHWSGSKWLGAMKEGNSIPIKCITSPAPCSILSFPLFCGSVNVEAVRLVLKVSVKATGGVGELAS